MMDLKTFKKKFDPFLFDFFDKKISHFRKYENKELIFYLEHTRKIFSEGKRLRPYLAFLTYKAYGGKKDKEAIELLIFIEIFHAFCLVHDDIIDNADKRHSLRTLHKISRSEKFGNSVAILIGDFLFNWAFEIILINKDFSKDHILKIAKIFLGKADEVIAGEFLDINLTQKQFVKNNEIYKKTFLKTSSYSFTNPLKIGSALAGKNDNKFLENMGEALGIGFQMQDDLLDIVSNSSQTNKSSFNDVRQGQHTAFTNYLMKNGNTKQKKLLKKYWGNNNIDEKSKEKLRKIFNDSGAISYGEKIIKDNFDKARAELKNSNMSGSYQKYFLVLINLIENRSS